MTNIQDYVFQHKQNGISMKRSDLEAMTRDDYENSPQHTLLRFFHNGAHKVIREAQDLKNILHLVAAEFELLGCCSDKYNLVHQQIRLLISESKHLMDFVSDLNKSIEPRKWTDWNNGPIDMQVEFQLNGQKFTILQGHYTVDTILSRVNQTIDGYNLFIEQGEDERMFMFPFDMLVEIKGNEIFHTQVKNGSSI